jgi:hypothetical protein
MSVVESRGLRWLLAFFCRRGSTPGLQTVVAPSKFESEVPVKEVMTIELINKLEHVSPAVEDSHPMVPICRGDTVIVIDGLDECSRPKQLLRSLHKAWERFSQFKLLFTSRLDVDVTEVFSEATTIQVDLGKTSNDIEEYIKLELQSDERKNSKIITSELADRTVKILTERA